MAQQYKRKSCADLSNAEWDLFFSAWNKCNDKFQIEKFRQIHDSSAQHTMQGMTHGIPGQRGNNTLFLSWHRKLIADFEDELHKAEPDCVFPYWNCALDELPARLRDFLPVCKTSSGGSRRCTRDVGRGESRPNQASIVRCYNEDRFDNFSEVLESGYHNAVHRYVGGSMAVMSDAPCDPLFYMHHAFCDFLWDQWQATTSDNWEGGPSKSYSLSPFSVTCDDVQTCGKIKRASGYGYYYLKGGAKDDKIILDKPVKEHVKEWEGETKKEEPKKKEEDHSGHDSGKKEDPKKKEDHSGHDSGKKEEPKKKEEDHSSHKKEEPKKHVEYCSCGRPKGHPRNLPPKGYRSHPRPRHEKPRFKPRD